MAKPTSKKESHWMEDDGGDPAYAKKQIKKARRRADKKSTTKES